MPTPRRLLIDLAAMLAIGATLTLLGPFGTFAAPLGARALFWLALLVGGYGLFMPAMRGAGVLAQRLALPEPALWAGACALASAPMTAVAWFANGLWGARGRPTADALATLYGEVLVVSGIACTVLWFLTAQRRRVVTDAGPAPEPVPVPVPVPVPPAAPPRLLARLPAHLRGDVIALEMEDHYVRAHTATGSALLLMRLGDAVAELDDVPGAAVHRSWWIARAAVTGVARDGRNVRLRLVNGVEAPVARAMVAGLRADGWI